MKVLLSAFACAPGLGSEPGIGWGVVSRVAAVHDAWILTHPSNRPRIEQALARAPLPRARFLYLRLPAALEAVAARPSFHHLYYCAWQWQAYRRARALAREVDFELVHHVTYGNHWLPASVGLLDLPFVWSAGGKDRTPWRLLSAMSGRGKLMEGARNLALWLAPKVLLTERLAARRASLIVSCSPPARWRRGLPVVQLPLGGLDDEELALLRRVPPRTDRPFRMVSIGRLLGWKGFDPALRAFARLRAESPESEYWIVGDGMERGHLERLARELGVHHAVRFLGWLPREEMFTVLAETDVLVHPSLHEQFGYVVLEAMAAGRPVVCVDPGGPALIVPDGLGLKVAAQTRGQLVSDLHAALVRLARNEALRVSLGRELRAHVEQHWTWEQVGARLLELYDRVATGALADPAAEKDAVPVERAVSAGKG